MIYMMPAVVALAVKLFLVYVAGQSLVSNNRPLAATLVALGACNLIELNGFIYADIEGAPLGLIGLKLYYAFLIVSGALLLRLSVGFIKKAVPKAFDFVMLTIVVSLTLLLFGDLLIVGYESIGYAITRVPGPYYWIIQIALFSAFVFPSISLAIGGWVYKNQRSRSLFFCSLPMMLVITSTVFLMMVGYRINAAMWFSSATTVFVVGIVYTESVHHRFALLSSLPGTADYHAKMKMLELARNALVDPSQLKKTQAAIDKIVAERCLLECGGNITEAARMIGVSPRTLKRRKDEALEE